MGEEGYGFDACQANWDRLIDDGQTSRSTGNRIKRALRQVVKAAVPQWQDDLRGIDIEYAIRQYAARNADKLQPTTLVLYESLARRGLREFLASFTSEPSDRVDDPSLLFVATTANGYVVRQFAQGHVLPDPSETMVDVAPAFMSPIAGGDIRVVGLPTPLAVTDAEVLMKIIAAKVADEAFNLDLLKQEMSTLAGSVGIYSVESFIAVLKTEAVMHGGAFAGRAEMVRLANELAGVLAPDQRNDLRLVNATSIVELFGNAFTGEELARLHSLKNILEAFLQRESVPSVSFPMEIETPVERRILLNDLPERLRPVDAAAAMKRIAAYVPSHEQAELRSRMACAYDPDRWLIDGFCECLAIDDAST